MSEAHLCQNNKYIYKIWDINYSLGKKPKKISKTFQVKKPQTHNFYQAILPQTRKFPFIFKLKLCKL